MDSKKSVKPSEAIRLQTTIEKIVTYRHLSKQPLCVSSSVIVSSGQWALHASCFPCLNVRSQNMSFAFFNLPSGLAKNCAYMYRQIVFYLFHQSLLCSSL